MFVRLASLALLLALTVALPRAAHAENCTTVIAFFSSPKDILDVVNMDNTLNIKRFISFGFIQNDGTQLGDSQVAIGGGARKQMTAQAVFATKAGLPAITDAYVVVRLSPSGPFGAWITQGGTITHPLLCVTY